MKLLISGEGPSDIGTCNNAQGVCTDDMFSPGPMTIWLKRLWEALLNYDVLSVPEAVMFVSKQTLAEGAKQSNKPLQQIRGKKKQVETGWFYSNAQQLGLRAKQLSELDKTPVMAVLFRDNDGTKSVPGQLWQTKWDSMLLGFKSVEFDFGVPMLPKPKSEAWLLCTTMQGNHSHAALEEISGNDDSPNSAKLQLDQAFGSHQSASQLADWCQATPLDWAQMSTMPSFKAFYDRFQAVANAILRPHAGVLV